ncbi:MAG: zinc ribbon domain-containing protein [Planctomycetota bacterium]
MFCSNCGKPGKGNFCAHCGHRFAEGTPEPEAPIDWENEVRYETLLRVPEVRSAIDRHGAMAKKGFTGEQFLAVFDKVSPIGVPLETVAAIAQPLYRKLGIATGKDRTETFSIPVGRVIVRVLCSLARNGQKLRGVQQGTDGCVLEAVLPSDLFSFEGELLVSVHRKGAGTEVRAVTKIPGQYFDWGKSKRCLERLVQELHVDPGTNDGFLYRRIAS